MGPEQALRELKQMILMDSNTENSTNRIEGDVVSKGMLGKGDQQESIKGKFKRLAVIVMKEVASRFETKESTYVSFNAAGPGSSGECWFRGARSNLEVVICPDSRDLGILYRIQKGSNSKNNWISWTDVNGMDDLVRPLHHLAIANNPDYKLPTDNRVSPVPLQAQRVSLTKRAAAKK